MKSGDSIMGDIILTCYPLLERERDLGYAGMVGKNRQSV